MVRRSDGSGAPAGRTAFIVLLLSAVTYDGLQETAPFGSAMNALFTALLPVIGALNTVLAVQTLLLLGLWLAFLAIFVLASWLTLRMHDPDRQPPALGASWAHTPPPSCRSRAAT